MILGVDIARFGEDHSVIAIRRGREIVGLKAWRGADTMKTAERISTEINVRRVSKTLVDEVGVGGGPVDRLRQLQKTGIIGVNVGRRAKDERTFSNLRAELGWRLRERFERGEVSIPDDAPLQAELAAYRYSYDSQARIRLEPKEETKRRVGRSPDRADAVMLAFAAEVVGSHVDVSEMLAGLVQANEDMYNIHRDSVSGEYSSPITPGFMDYH